MTKRKNPEFDSRRGDGKTFTRKRTRRTPEELERARKSGENVRDQRGGERRRSIKIDGKRLSAEDRGIDKRFASDRARLTQVSNDLDKAVDWRSTLRERLEELKRSMFAEARRNDNKISLTDSNKVKGLESDMSRINQKVDTLRKEKSDLEHKLKK